MTQPSPRRYLETQILTASRERLLLMLYDGAIRFAEQGRDALAAKELEKAHESLVKVQRIVVELWCALNPSVDPELSKTLGGLYAFLYLRLVHANVHRDLHAADEAIGVLRRLREAWGEAVAAVKQGETPVEADPAGVQASG